jgi:predicted acyl esterase
VIVTTFPNAVHVIEHTLIPLKDGTTLAARIWLPDDAEQNPVPAILEYLPYRKRDGTFERDGSQRHKVPARESDASLPACWYYWKKS